MSSLSPDGRVLVFLRSLSSYNCEFYMVPLAPDLAARRASVKAVRGEE